MHKKFDFKFNIMSNGHINSEKGIYNKIFNWKIRNINSVLTVYLVDDIKDEKTLYNNPVSYITYKGITYYTRYEENENRRVFCKLNKKPDIRVYNKEYYIKSECSDEIYYDIVKIPKDYNLYNPDFDYNYELYY